MIAPPRSPSQDEPEALIREARARQLRRRLLAAAGVAAAAAMGLGVYGPTSGGGNGRPAARGDRAGAPLCRSSQLSASGLWNGAVGHLFDAVVIANRSDSACSLPSGRPQVRITSQGAVLPTHEQAGNLSNVFPAGMRVHELAAGAKAVVYLGWTNWCGRLPAKATTTVALRFSGTLRVSTGQMVGQPPCLHRREPSVLQVTRLQTLN